MGGVCLCSSWTSRALWPLVLVLAAVPWPLRCSHSPAAGVGKVYPRGNHWAVGHLMGKKSIETLPELQETNGDHLTASERSGAAELDRYELLRAAGRQKNTQEQTMPQTADERLQLHSGWREEDRNKYLRKVTDLFLLALRPQDNDST